MLCGTAQGKVVAISDVEFFKMDLFAMLSCYTFLRFDVDNRSSSESLFYKQPQHHQHVREYLYNIKRLFGSLTVGDRPSTGPALAA